MKPQKVLDEEIEKAFWRVLWLFVTWFTSLSLMAQIFTLPFQTEAKSGCEV